MRTLILLLISVNLFAQKVELKLPDTYRTGETLEFLSYPVFAFSGIAGGMGERFLSKDGNWDTRSHRSHVWRDISIYTTAAGASMFSVGITLQGKVKPKDLLKVIGAGAMYYVGTRVGYNLGQFF